MNHKFFHDFQMREKIKDTTDRVLEQNLNKSIFKDLIENQDEETTSIKYLRIRLDGDDLVMSLLPDSSKN